MNALITDEQGLRFQRRYDDVITVLEGQELQRLISRFFWHYDRLSKKHPEPGKAFVAAVLLHGLSCTP